MGVELGGKSHRMGKKKKHLEMTFSKNWSKYERCQSTVFNGKSHFNM